MTTKLQMAINIATTPSENARLILNNEEAIKNNSMCYTNSKGDILFEKLNKADFEIFNAVACRCRHEFNKFIK